MLKKYLWLIQIVSISLIIIAVSSSMTPLIVAKSAQIYKTTIDSPTVTQTDPVTEFPISSSALNIVTSAPNSVWFTMPLASKIGHLTVDANGNATVNEYATPTANSEPYDLVYDSSNNVIWFTEKSANQLGRFDIATETITEISTIPTANSMPTGIGIAPDGSIWFAESGANRLGQYMPTTNTFRESVVYVPRTAGVTNAEFTDIAVSTSGTRIWVSSPADHKVLQYSAQTDEFASLALSGPFDPIAGDSRQPYNLTVASGDVVWLTDIANNQIGKFFQGTLTNVAWYTLPTSGSSPTGITVGETASGVSTVFFTENATDRAGSLINGNNNTIQPKEFGLASGSQPAGITIDSDGTVWIAQGGSNTIAQWEAPYFNSIYLPLIEKS